MRVVEDVVSGVNHLQLLKMNDSTDRGHQTRGEEQVLG